MGTKKSHDEERLPCKAAFSTYNIYKKFYNL